MLRRFQDAGHRPIALAGGATGMVGDPSGRSEERNLLDEATLDPNVAAIKRQMPADRSTPAAPTARARRQPRLDRATSRCSTFLRDVGKHVTVNQMLARDSVRARLESEHGISFTEFSYMLLQANDYCLAARAPRLRAPDRRLGPVGQHPRRASTSSAGAPGATVHALCWPLLTARRRLEARQDHRRAVWLDPASDVAVRVLPALRSRSTTARSAPAPARFTLLPVDEIEDQVVADHGAHPERRLAQRRAGRRGHRARARRGGAAAAEASSILFGGPIHDATPAALDSVADEVPTHHVTGPRQAGLGLSMLLATSGLTRSRSEARRAIDQGGAYVNNERADGSTALGHGLAVRPLDPAEPRATQPRPGGGRRLIRSVGTTQVGR